MSSVRAIVDILVDLLQSKPDHVERFKIGETEFGFIPDLDDMSLGEYIDLDNNASQWQNMHVAMNVLYRPIKTSKLGKYNIEDYNVKNPEAMKDMPLGAAIGSLFFFYNLGIELANHTILYSNNQAEMEIYQDQLTSIENGDGINQFMDSLTEILQNLKISLN